MTFVPPPRYRLLRQIGEGASGTVYEAVDQERGVRVALKTLERASARGRERVRREFDALAGIRHRNLVPLGELVMDHEPCFFTMELVDGAEPIAWIRRGQPAPAFDEARLRETFAQLARALVALHEAGKIHRDVKPDNVRVRSDGRLVLLDFGLVTDAEPEQRATEPHVVGTPKYMAPEQASVSDMGPPADWYAFGCVLYEALAGRVPFEGGELDVMMCKQRDEPPLLRALVPQVPADLEGLCLDLLRFDPVARPTGRDVVRRILGATPEIAVDSRAEDHAPFVGREAELDVIGAAFDRSREGTALALLIEGESGVGKTALVRRALSRLGESARFVLFEGACSERASLPFKAFDGIADGLAAFLGSLSDAEADALLPHHAGLLARTFPVLGRVPCLSAGPVPEQGSLDPQEERSRVFGALRELFVRLGARRAVVLFVDDLQWADADSLALLSEIVRQPDGAELLLVATSRTGGFVPNVGFARAGRLEIQTLGVERLRDAEALELAALLTTQRGADSGLHVDAAAVVREARGHPMFIDELVRHASTGKSAAQAALRLDDALWARIEQLGESERQMVKLIAVSGAAIRVPVLERAADLDADVARRQLGHLREASLVRAVRDGRTDVAEPYHDRIREAVLAHLPAPEKQELHRKIALALAADRAADPETLFVHWLAAGDSARAADHAEEAGAAAERALAFTHAAHLLRQAMDLRARDGVPPASLRRRLADALANAGMGHDAAREYLIAAAGAGAAEAFDLRQRAAEQFLLAGFLDEGLGTSRELLATAGMRLPATPVQAILSYLLRRIVIRLRGLRFVERAEADVAKLQLSVVDLCWSLSFALSVVDPVRGADFQARCLLWSLKLGEPLRVARALAMEASLGAAMGDGWGATQEKATRAVSLAGRVGSPRAMALATGMAGTAAYLAGHFELARAQLDESLARFRDVAGVWSETARARYFVVITLAYLGEIAELASRVPIYLREAAERGDRYAQTSSRTSIGTEILYLARDDARGLREEIDGAMEAWSKDGFHVPHYQALLARSNADLYDGDGAAAWRRVEEEWTPLRRSMLLRIEIVRTQAYFLRARAALAVAAVDASGRRGLLNEATRYARRCIRERSRFGVPAGHLLLACCASLEGDRDESAARLERAAAGFDATAVPVHAEVCRYARAELRGGHEGEAARDAAARSMLGRGIAAPAKFVRLLAPGVLRRA